MAYLLNRWYDPQVGRWINEDPIGFAGGDANQSRYVGNHPTNAKDPTGLSEYASLDEEDDAMGGPTYTESSYRTIRSHHVELGSAMLALANDGRCHTLSEILDRAKVLATTTGYRDKVLMSQPKFYRRAVEDVEKSMIITASSLIVFGMNWFYSGMHGFVELFGAEEGNNGPGDCWLQMEMQRNNLLIRRIDVISKRIKEIRAIRPDLIVP